MSIQPKIIPIIALASGAALLAAFAATAGNHQGWGRHAVFLSRLCRDRDGSTDWISEKASETGDEETV